MCLGGLILTIQVALKIRRVLCLRFTGVVTPSSTEFCGGPPPYPSGLLILTCLCGSVGWQMVRPGGDDSHSKARQRWMREEASLHLGPQLPPQHPFSHMRLSWCVHMPSLPPPPLPSATFSFHVTSSRMLSRPPSSHRAVPLPS